MHQSQVKPTRGSSLLRTIDAKQMTMLFDPQKSYGETRKSFELEFEKHYVAWLLERHHHNLSAASREARMDRKHLHDLAKKHDLRWPYESSH